MIAHSFDYKIERFNVAHVRENASSFVAESSTIEPAFVNRVNYVSAVAVCKLGRLV